MSTLTIRLPDDKHERLKALAKSNGISVNKLMDEPATVALANYDARVRFETRAVAGVNYLGRSTTTILAGQARGSCR